MASNINNTFRIQRTNALTNSPVLLQSGITDLKGWTIVNKNAAVEFIQCFNAAAPTDVFLGTTVPTYVIPVTTGVDVGTIWNMPDNMRLTFNLGLVVACTTTETGSTAPATNPVNCYFFIQ
jgi:hypothetical protein